MEAKVWVPAIVSIITLIINIAFYVCVQSRLGYEYKRKEDLATICEEFFAFLSELVSYEEFEGVPTCIRNYSLKIHLCFVNGMADENISRELEEIYRMTKDRKKLKDLKEINDWNEKFRNKVRKLRKEIGKYCGGIKVEDN